MLRDGICPKIVLPSISLGFGYVCWKFPNLDVALARFVLLIKRRVENDPRRNLQIFLINYLSVKVQRLENKIHETYLTGTSTFFWELNYGVIFEYLILSCHCTLYRCRHCKNIRKHLANPNLILLFAHNFYEKSLSNEGQYIAKLK